MCRFIGMEYLAAAAFIALDKEDVTLDELSQYGINVIKILEDSHISAVILCSEHYALEMVRNFSDCFDLINDDSTLHLKVAKDILIARFLAYMSKDLLSAFTQQMAKWAKSQK